MVPFEKSEMLVAGSVSRRKPCCRLPAMSVLATIEPAELQVDAGNETSLVVRVRNRGTIVDQFDIKVVGPTGHWASVDPTLPAPVSRQGG